MATTIKTAIAIQKTLFDQAETLAQRLNISPKHLFELAIENFIAHCESQALLDKANAVYTDQPHSTEQSISPSQDAKTVTQISGRHMAINQGDIYWVQAAEPNGSELGYYPHPYVVVQEDVFNRSRIKTVVVCALTSNMKQANEPGNVLLDVGEANLPAIPAARACSAGKSAVAQKSGENIDQARARRGKRVWQ